MEANIAMIFDAFSSNSLGESNGLMDGRQFSKMAKDSKFLGKKITMTDIDIIFAKVKGKTSRKINLEEFTLALEMLAKKKGKSLDDFVDMIVDAGGPKFTGTRADKVALHDDKDNYTGVYKGGGGPSTVDGIHTANLSGIVDRTDGVHIHDENPPSSTKTPPKATVVAKGSPAASLSAVFERFTNGSPEMDGRQLAKLAKDTKIIGKKVTTTDIDIDFSRVKPKGARKITFLQFEELITMWAKKKGLSPVDFQDHVLKHGGPSFSGTKAAKTRLHDDKSGYTGVYAKGGPSTQGSGRYDDIGRINDLSQLADRSGASVRGVKY